MNKNTKKLYEDLNTYIQILEDNTPRYVVGFDETGNGALAGPLCVAGCALSIDYAGKVKDSKNYSEKARKAAYEIVEKDALAAKSFMAMPSLIEEVGHGAALYELYRVALLYFYELYGDDAVYLMDGNQTVRNSDVKHFCLVKGDVFVPAISAASVVAKVERDYMMTHTDHEGYNFAKHKGYPTKEHLEELNRLGPIQDFHRIGIEKVRKAYEKNGWYK